MSTTREFQFALVADTHYMLDSGNAALEFESRRLQSQRAQAALRQIADLELPLVIHMGDLVQEFPERPNFAQALTSALKEIEICGLDPIFVAGNHDVGDKPDPTMPAEQVKAEFLAYYHDRVGPSWRSWDQGGVHFVVINSQILNSELPASYEQKRWLEADLAANRGRIFLFTHLPPFLFSPSEDHLGHYDNIGEPDRSWLLALLAEHRVEALFCAHVHFAFFNRLGPTSIWTVPSVAFTRPGFAELFSSAPPPEQGRDDSAKLGFLLVSVYAKGHRVEFVRTGGDTTLPDEFPGAMSTIQKRKKVRPPLGVALERPLTTTAQVPVAWPSFVRQPVRNDYPLLLLRELGAGHIITPLQDLWDPLQFEGLSLLTEDGVNIIGSCLWHPALNLEALVERAAPILKEILVLLPATRIPTQTLLNACTRMYEGGMPMLLSTIPPARYVAGKQHARARIGYSRADVEEVRTLLSAPIRLLCRLDIDLDSGQWNPMDFPELDVDWIFRPPSADDKLNRRWSEKALDAILEGGRSRIFFEPYIDLDRTMDRATGLLDRLCNPSLTFLTLRDRIRKEFRSPGDS